MRALARSGAIAAVVVCAGGCLGSSAATPAAPATPPTYRSVAPSATMPANQQTMRVPRNPFSRRSEHQLRHHRRTMSAGALDIATGAQSVRNGNVSAYAASIVKVAILLAAEQRAREQGHGLTPAQRSAAKLMIDASDNDAATTLWQEAGKSRGLFAVFRQIGMSHTRHAPQLLEPWDGVMTTADDQLKLLHALTAGLRGVTTGDRHYVLRLMRHVEADQDWGVPTGTKPHWSVAVKNGWVPVGQRWTVNTIGIVRGAHHRHYALVILSVGSASEAAGIHQLDPIARSVAHRWG